jgi:hypothetical protein
VNNLLKNPFANYRTSPWWLRATLTLLFLTPLAQAQEKSTTTIEFRVTRFDPGDGKPPEFRAGTESETFQVPITYIAGPFKATLRDDFVHPRTGHLAFHAVAERL